MEAGNESMAGMSTFFLFISDLFHQVLFYLGVVGTGVFLIEKLWKPIERKRWFVIAGLICLFVACYQGWLDEHRNTETVIAEKASEAGLKNSCLTDLRVEGAFAKGQESMNGSQRQTLDRQQDTIAKQQTAVNSCVVSLGKMNPQVILKTSALYIPVASQNKPGISRYAPPVTTAFGVIVISTNEHIEPTGRLKCDQPFDPSAPLLPQEGTVLSAPVSPTKISDREYEIRVNQMGQDWTPNSPIYMTTTSAIALGKCSFLPQQ
jgi:arginine exporter protein ArgO